jgi:hypothetical protein
MLGQGRTSFLLISFSLILYDLDRIAKKKFVLLELFMLLIDKEIINLSA